LHGLYADTPGFQYLQQSALAMHATRHGFTVLLPTAPLDKGAYAWPTSLEAREKQEEAVLTSIRASRTKLEQTIGHGFDEVFVIGFSSGAYYGSSLAVRGPLATDGFMALAGATPRVSPVVNEKRTPIFVGISGQDPQTRDHSRSFAGSLATVKWPYHAEELQTGHMVDWTFMARGLAWLRAQKDATKPKDVAASP
jgi:predicted esterase